MVNQPLKLFVVSVVPRCLELVPKMVFTIDEEPRFGGVFHGSTHSVRSPLFIAGAKLQGFSHMGLTNDILICQISDSPGQLENPMIAAS